MENLLLQHNVSCHNWLDLFKTATILELMKHKDGNLHSIVINSNLDKQCSCCQLIFLFSRNLYKVMLSSYLTQYKCRCATYTYLDIWKRWRLLLGHVYSIFTDKYNLDWKHKQPTILTGSCKRWIQLWCSIS